MREIKQALLRASIVLVPTYTVAFLTGKMVYVMPMLAAASFFAAGVKFNKNNVDAGNDDSDLDTE